MTEKNASSFFNKIFLISAILLVIVGAYIVYMYNNTESTSMSLIVEKQKLVDELKLKRDSLDVAIRDNEEFKWDFIVQKNKVSEILVALEKNDLNLEAILEYKSEIKELDQKEIVQKKKREKFLKNRKEIEK